METPLFFKNNSCNLFGVLHQPDDTTDILFPAPSSLRDCGIVFCSPFAEEKLISHRAMVNLARSLTAMGIHCLRFDYRGHGDSESDFQDATIESRISDIHCAVKFLSAQNGVNKIGLLGLRLGATLASLSCTNDIINFLIVIAPIINGKTYIEQCLRSNLTTQVATYKKILKDRKQLIDDLLADKQVNIDGYLLTKILYTQIGAIDLLTSPTTHPGNILLVQHSKRDNQPIEDTMKHLYMKFKKINPCVELLQSSGDYFWADTKRYTSQAADIKPLLIDWFCKTTTI